MTDTTPTNPSDIQAVLDAQLVKAGADISHVQVSEYIDDFVSVFTHSDITHQLIDTEELVAKHRPNPRRATGVHRVRTLDGLASAIARHRNDGVATPVVYHDPETLQVTAVLNDHEPYAQVAAGWRDHRIHWTPTLTPEWNHWVSHQGQHGQLEFAEVLEDGEAEIVEPTAADMLEIATTFAATRNAKYRAAGRPKTGITQFVYEEQTTAKAGEKGELTIPDSFTIVVRPFFGADAFKVKARIRYRASGDAFTIGYQLHRPDDVIRHAFAAHVGELLQGLEDVDSIEGLA